MLGDNSLLICFLFLNAGLKSLSQYNLASYNVFIIYEKSYIDLSNPNAGYPKKNKQPFILYERTGTNQKLYYQPA